MNEHPRACQIVVCDWCPSTPAGRWSSLRSTTFELPAASRFHGMR